jgi:hypothetical protein
LSPRDRALARLAEAVERLEAALAARRRACGLDGAGAEAGEKAAGEALAELDRTIVRLRTLMGEAGRG